MNGRFGFIDGSEIIVMTPMRFTANKFRMIYSQAYYFPMLIQSMWMWNLISEFEEVQIIYEYPSCSTQNRFISGAYCILIAK